MESIFPITIFILGLLIGSFLNVCIYRIPRGESIAYPPSHCTSCGSNIKSYDLIPVISWIFLSGKCRGCGQKISIRYALVELATAILFLLTYFQYGVSIFILRYLILIPFLIVIAMIDYDTMEVYTTTTWVAIAMGIVLLGVNFYLGQAVATYLYGALFGAGFIIIIILLSKLIIGIEGMGWGDAEICGLCGLFLGFKLTLIMMFFSFIIGGIVGIYLLRFKKKNGRSEMPFGPSIIMATFLIIIWGDKILNWYLSTFQ
ncbi:prepilin peptidase [Clostridium tagluense]|uniref:prepilin peptidase n=1 Tax=Clostridium tagluense TaxID=360422 RepID=UPI001CF57152|nr:A24 family peptidase [Clostridium tagluense]MCB2312676.1 prepilin peptidase [Clostridium tagluense]MCB2317442.1 prepilin peptidase [Clostridium tagluense]MCB2322209.1 prepilin peptidase [Clostridium tagluense]MCB2327215.1 prepilin peptidase [Clostridium tagluense]MCB2331943.1 prepilin peptidase [Clostridium tagluense]